MLSFVASIRAFAGQIYAATARPLVSTSQCKRILWVVGRAHGLDRLGVERL